MLKKNQMVEVKWGTKNKDWFTKKGYIFTKFGDAILVKAEDLMTTSKVRVTVICDMCNKEEYEISFYSYTKSKTKKHLCKKCNSSKNQISVKCKTCKKEFKSTNTALNRSKSGNLFCSNVCVGKYNKKTRSRKIEKSCLICYQPYSVKPARKKTSVTCSVACQNKWQSKYLIGKKANNYKGGNRIKTCEYCNSAYECMSPYQYQNRKFCGEKCKHKHWEENVITTNSFKKNRREGNVAHRKKMSKNKIETKPERLMREHLESLNMKKNYDFFQEQGFMGKYFADFYIPHTKTVIEVHGDYWHGNPKMYGDGKIPLNETQKDRIRRDKEKREDFIESGYNYIEIWETDIYKNTKDALEKHTLKIYPRNDYTQDVQTYKDVDDDIV